MKTRRFVVGTLLLGTAMAAALAAPLDDMRARWTDPQLVQRINDGIEQNRKGVAVVQVRDGAGKPMAGVEVSATQTAHAFLFGCNLFVLGQLETPELNAKYEKSFTGLFNFASLPFYWKDLEPQQGAPRFDENAPFIWRRPPPDVTLKWCKAHGITPKGHPLLWHSINPDWMPTEPEALRAAYGKRFKEIADRYAADIPIWDVVNESLVCPKTYPFYSEDRAYVAWAFELAHQYFDNTKVLMINEVTEVSHKPIAENRYYTQVDSLLKAGAGVEGIGFQFHFFSQDALTKTFFGAGDMAPTSLLDVYESFAKFGLPLYVTEITIPATGPDGAAIQAEVVTNLYRLWFSAKGMAGVTWWNLGDKTAYENENNAMAGLLDENMNPKPAYEALDKLINHEWKTTFKGKTDADGRCEFRGFAGAYKLDFVRPDGKTWQSDISIASGMTATRNFTSE